MKEISGRKIPGKRWSASTSQSVICKAMEKNEAKGLERTPVKVNHTDKEKEVHEK